MTGCGRFASVFPNFPRLSRHSLLDYVATFLRSDQLQEFH